MITSKTILDYYICNEQKQAKEARDFTSLNYVLDNLTRLSKRINKHILNDEQDLIRKRYRLWVQYIMTKDTCEKELNLDDKKKLDEISKRLNDKFPLRI